jgi:mannose-6-phosphate isomerase-like protein (cupin superfamily)
MNVKIDTVSPQLFNVFHVCQITPGTFLSGFAGIDYIEILPNQVSEVHRHNESDALLFVISGSARAELDQEFYDIKAGMRVLIPKGMTHGFRTGEEKFQFVSIQIPPIQDDSTDRFDRDIIR